MSTLTLTTLITLGIIAAGVLAMRRALARLRDDPEYQMRLREYRERMRTRDESYKLEETVMEEAPWFGQTGLSDETERELPKHLRREFGELLLDEGSLKAADLEYLGVFEEDGVTVHYWRIAPREPGGTPTYAYATLTPEGECLGWGSHGPGEKRDEDED